jgi:tetratricopeptide (TPR) repeat protein
MRTWLYSLVLLAFVAASPAQATWREASSKHFVIYSEQSAKVVQEFAESLERYDKGLRVLFNVPDEQTSHASRVTVFVVPNITAVRRLLGPNAPSGLAGFYRNWAAGPVAFVPRGTGDAAGVGFDNQLVLQHEYAHHFLMQNFSGVFPAWFNEGFAEFAATADLNKDGSLNLGMAANHRAYGLLVESPLPIERLLDSTPSARDGAERERFYGRAWLLCHYLITDATRRSQLPVYIKRLNAGGTNLDAARAAFGDLNQLNKDLNAYLRRIQSKMMGFRLPREALSFSKVTVRELGPGEAAIMDARIQSKAGVDRKEAPQVLALARKAAAPFPNDAAAQTALAEAEFDAGNYAEAEAAADRAIAADPKAVDALTYKGLARMRQAVMADKHDAPTWTEVRKWFLAANKVDAEDPEPLTNFFYSFLRQGIEPTANAVAAGTHSLELAPQDTELRIIIVQYMLRHGKSAEARSALLRLASMPHGGEIQQRASAVLTALDTGGTEAAIRAMRSNPTASAGEGLSDGKE